MTVSARVEDILRDSLDDRTVTVRGWLQNRRSTGGVAFLLIRDGSGVVQATLRKDSVDEETFDALTRTGLESVVEVSGHVRPDSRAPGGREIVVVSGRIQDAARDEFPIAKKFHGPEFLLDQRHLVIRSDKMRSMLRVRAVVLSAVREWFDKHHFLEVQVPTLTSAAVEGGSTLFEVKYFDEKAYLTQSWQLYAEALVASVGRIYTVAPSFRAEKSRTRRHLTEYWHVEAEAPWCDLDCIMRVEEELLTFVVGQVLEKCGMELELFGRKREDLLRIQVPFPRITYADAFKMIGGEASGIKFGDDLGYEQEKLLTQHFDRPFFVTGYPKKAKAFYHKPDPSNPEVTLSVDMLAPEGYGEITGGGQRIDDYDMLLARIREEGLDEKNYSWYLDLRKYGSVPHSGFGMGLERVVSWLLKLEHIRDAIAFPRLINRIYP